MCCGSLQVAAQDAMNLPARPYFRLLEPSRADPTARQWYATMQQLENALNENAWDSTFSEKERRERRLSILKRIVTHTQGTEDHKKWVREYIDVLVDDAYRNSQSMVGTQLTELANDLNRKGLTDEAAYADYRANNAVRSAHLENGNINTYCEEARRTLPDLLRKYPTSSVADEAMYELVGCCMTLRDEASALLWCRTLVERFPASRHRTAAAGIIKRLTSLGKQLDLVFADSVGTQHAIADFRGRVVVLFFMSSDNDMKYATPVLRQLQSKGSGDSLQLVCVRHVWSDDWTPDAPLESVIDVCYRESGGIDEQLGFPRALTAMIIDASGIVAARDVPVAKLCESLDILTRDSELVVTFCTWEEWSIMHLPTAPLVAAGTLTKEAFRSVVASLAAERKMARIIWDPRVSPDIVTETELRQQIEGILQEHGYQQITFSRALPSTTRDRDQTPGNDTP